MAAQLLAALRFGAARHAEQPRKDHKTPFINHPIIVAELLAGPGGVSDVAILQATILHDTLEDTETTPNELRDMFGEQVCSLVKEVTDDKQLPQAERKRRQVAHAPHLSAGAKQIRIADKISNMADLSHSQPPEWSLQRKLEYLDWAEQVVAGCRGCNPALEQAFEGMLRRKREELAQPAAV